MARHDYMIAQQLGKNAQVTFTSLIMAAIIKCEKQSYPALRHAFRNVVHEYWDRRYGVRGYLRGENAEADAEYYVRDYEAETLDMRRPK